MIENIIRNPQTLRQYRSFKSQRRSVFAVFILGVLLFVSATAEFWANSQPIVAKYKGQIYWPVYKTYYPDVFGQEGEVLVDYRKVEWGSDGWAIWPIVRWDPYESNKSVENYPSAPTQENYLGTDDRGRDVLARLIYGFRYSMGYALFVWVLTYVIGIATGAAMGYWGGAVDMWGQRLVEIFDSVPTLLLLITLIAMFSATMGLLVVFSSLFGWMMISIYMRAEFLKLRRREFVEAARAMGASRTRIIFRHILPNALGPVLTLSSFTIAGGISSLAALDYLGFGLPAPTPSWGELLNQAQRNFTIAWWLAAFPSAALFVSLVSLNLIGEGVRDAFDPRNK